MNGERRREGQLPARRVRIGAEHGERHGANENPGDECRGPSQRRVQARSIQAQARPNARIGGVRTSAYGLAKPGDRQERAPGRELTRASIRGAVERPDGRDRDRERRLPRRVEDVRLQRAGSEHERPADDGGAPRMIPPRDRAPREAGEHEMQRQRRQEERAGTRAEDAEHEGREGRVDRRLVAAPPEEARQLAAQHVHRLQPDDGRVGVRLRRVHDRRPAEGDRGNEHEDQRPSALLRSGDAHRQTGTAPWPARASGSVAHVRLRSCAHFTVGGVGGGGAGGVESGVTHEDRSKSMNSSAFSCGVSAEAAHPVGTLLSPE